MRTKQTLLSILGCVLLGSILFLASSCVPMAASRNIQIGRSTKEDRCESQGGRWFIPARNIPGTASPKPECIMPTSDSGNLCTQSSQCEGYCQPKEVYEESITIPESQIMLTAPEELANTVPVIEPTVPYTITRIMDVIEYFQDEEIVRSALQGTGLETMNVEELEALVYGYFQEHRSITQGYCSQWPKYNLGCYTKISYGQIKVICQD